MTREDACLPLFFYGPHVKRHMATEEFDDETLMAALADPHVHFALPALHDGTSSKSAYWNPHVQCFRYCTGPSEAGKRLQKDNPQFQPAPVPFLQWACKHDPENYTPYHDAYVAGTLGKGKNCRLLKAAFAELTHEHDNGGGGAGSNLFDDAEEEESTLDAARVSALPSLSPASANVLANAIAAATTSQLTPIIEKSSNLTVDRVNKHTTTAVAPVAHALQEEAEKNAKWRKEQAELRDKEAAAVRKKEFEAEQAAAAQRFEDKERAAAAATAQRVHAEQLQAEVRAQAHSSLAPGTSNPALSSRTHLTRSDACLRPFPPADSAQLKQQSRPRAPGPAGAGRRAAYRPQPDLEAVPVRARQYGRLAPRLLHRHHRRNRDQRGHAGAAEARPRYALSVHLVLRRPQPLRHPVRHPADQGRGGGDLRGARDARGIVVRVERFARVGALGIVLVERLARADDARRRWWRRRRGTASLPTILSNYRTTTLPPPSV